MESLEYYLLLAAIIALGIWNYNRLRKRLPDVL